MTEDREYQDAKTEISAAYRECAGERAPEALNQRILAMADGAATDSKRRFLSGWNRPLAWAATIGLSLAIVFEASQYQGTANSEVAPVLMEVDSADSHAPASVREDFVPQNPSVVDDATRQARERNGPTREQASPESGRNNYLPQVSSPKIEKKPEGPAESESEFDVPAPATVELRRSVDSNAGPDDARFDSQQEAATDADIQSFAVMPARCGDADKATAALWYACVEELRAAGLTTHADREMANLAAEYPDFQPEN